MNVGLITVRDRNVENELQFKRKLQKRFVGIFAGLYLIGL